MFDLQPIANSTNFTMKEYFLHPWSTFFHDNSNLIVTYIQCWKLFSRKSLFSQIFSLLHLPVFILAFKFVSLVLVLLYFWTLDHSTGTMSVRSSTTTLWRVLEGSSSEKWWLILFVTYDLKTKQKNLADSWTFWLGPLKK